MAAPVEALQSVSDIGPVVAASVRAFADEPRNRALVTRLQEAGVNMASQAPEPTDQPGRWPARLRPYRHAATMSREEATEALERLGAGSPARSARRQATSSSGADAGSKLEKAQKLGVETLDEEAFLALIMKRC